MLEYESKTLLYDIKTFLFSDYPFDVEYCNYVRFISCKNNVDIKGFSKSSSTALIIDLTEDLDQIWKNMSKSSCRYAINKAKRDGAIVHVNNNHEDFLKIVTNFRVEKKYSRFALSSEFIKSKCTLFVAMYEGEVLSGQLYLEGMDEIFLFIGASKRLEVKKEKATLIGNANKLLVWEAIKYYKDKGKKEFYLGAHWFEDPMNLFLKSFGGKLVMRYNYEKCYSKKIMLALYAYRTIPALLRLINVKIS
jgi:hypothetical protein